jgi:hypothetical protein
MSYRRKQPKNLPFENDPALTVENDPALTVVLLPYCVSVKSDYLFIAEC